VPVHSGTPEPVVLLKVKVILLYGADNPIDGAVLNVLLRKAREIHKTLGITVPLPVESESVMETVLKALFLHDGGTQLSLFGDAQIVEVHRKWDFSVEKEKKSRTLFAFNVYDITVVSPHTLFNVKRNVAISGNNTSVNVGTLLEGNANNDEKVNIQDFGILASTYGKLSGDAGFDARADFDRNDKINITDFGLLAANYGKYNPIEVP
jgi:hypothetical protein